MMERKADYNVNLSLLELAIERGTERLKLTNKILESNKQYELDQCLLEVEQLLEETLLEQPEKNMLKNMAELVKEQKQLLKILYG